MRKCDAVWIEKRAAEIAAMMLYDDLHHNMNVQELVGFMSAGDPARAERSYPKTKYWHAGWLAALIWTHDDP